MTPWSHVASVAPLALALAACSGPEASAPRAPTPSRPPASAPAAEAPPRAPGDRGAAIYRGHGAESVSPADLERYRPRPLPAPVARRIQSLLDLRGPGVGQLSPDGRALVFGWSVTGVPQVWRIDGPMRFPSQMTGGEDPTWLQAVTPDGKHAILSRDRKGEENPGLYLQPLAGGALIEIQHKPKVQTFFDFVTDDSRTIYFHANDIKPDAQAIYRFDVARRQRERVFSEDGLWHVADARPDGRLLLCRSTGSLSAEYFEWDSRAKKLTPLLGQKEKEEYAAVYGPREGELIVQTNKLGDFRRLYSWKKGQLTPITDPMRFDVAGFNVDRKKSRLLIEINENGYTRLRAIDLRTLGPIALPKLPDADHVLAGGTTPDGRFTTLGIDDGRHPLQAVVVDWKRRRVDTWHRPSTPEIDTTRFARAALESYPARDGTKIPVFVRRPEGCDSKLCPVVVHFHGGPEGQSFPGFSVHAQFFVDAGFIFVEPNVRGSDGYGKAWLRADDGAKRLDVITDVEDAARWARARFARGGRQPKVGIYGGSYGGYMTLMGMTLFAGAYDAGVDIVGISNLITFLKNTAPYRRILRISEYGDPDKDRDVLRRLSPITYIERVKSPLLILHGATDPRVPAGEAIQIQNALARKGIASQLMIFPDEGHGAQTRQNRALQYGHTIAFLRKHLADR